MIRWFAVDPPREVGHWDERTYSEIGSDEKKTSKDRTPIMIADRTTGAVYHDRDLTEEDFAALTLLPSDGRGEA